MSEVPHILCVDDQRMAVEVRAVLLRQFGCVVFVAENAEQALATLREKEIDLVLMDYHLGWNVMGDEVAREIRTLAPKMPVIMLTGDPKISDDARASVSAVLIKGSSSPADLWETIQELLPEKKLKPRRGPLTYVPPRAN